MPFNNDTESRMLRFTHGTLVKCTGLVQPRSLPVHNAYWATLTNIVENTNAAPTADHLHDFLVKACNYVSMICDKSGKPVDTVRDSTAFDEMGEAEYQEYLRTAKMVLAQRLDIIWDDYVLKKKAA